MIDFHSHILPEVDDGAQSLDESLKMLQAEMASGVNTVVLTPHCHPRSQEKIDSFITRRENAYNKLMEAASSYELPRLIRSAEIRIYKGFSKYSRLSELLIDGTDYILLEMPYERWTEDTIEEIYQVTQLGFKPIIAHIDRFLDQSDFFGELSALDVVFQINTSAILEKSERRHMPSLLDANRAHILGSDTHNLTDRPPNIAAAYDMLSRKFGAEYSDFFKENGSCILNNKPIISKNFPKLGIVKRIFL